MTVRPKPEKRKNYKERAKERTKERAKEKDFKKSTEDGTTPDTTAKAKSKVQDKVKDKVEQPKRSKLKARDQEGQEDQIGGPHSRLSLSAASRHSPPSAPGCVKRPPPRTGAKRVWAVGPGGAFAPRAMRGGWPPARSGGGRVGVGARNGLPHPVRAFGSDHPPLKGRDEARRPPFLDSSTPRR